MNRHITFARCFWPLLVCISIACVLCSAAAPQQAGSASSTSRGDNVNLPAAFSKILRDYEKAWTAKDAMGLASIFAEDAFVLPNGGAPVRGRANIEQHYAGAGGPLHLRAMAWAQAGDIGYIIGEYAPDAEFTNKGKFTLTLTRANADAPWLIMSDMDNANSRPRPQQQRPQPGP
jgi:ketosteroid isomerase-like protein